MRAQPFAVSGEVSDVFLCISPGIIGDAPKSTRELLQILVYSDPESIPVQMLRDGRTARPGLTDYYKDDNSSDRIVQDIRDKQSRFRGLKGALRKPVSQGVIAGNVEETILEPSDECFRRIQRLVVNPVDLSKSIQCPQDPPLISQRVIEGRPTLWLHDLVQLILHSELTSRTKEQQTWIRT